MKTLQVKENKRFFGREAEIEQLEEIASRAEAKILIVYGRRRVGKTELLEQTFRKRKLLKFEGLENQNEASQRHFVMQQLAHYAEEPLLKHLYPESWVDVFKYLAEVTKKGVWTLYFEEVQWLANYKSDFVSGLKYVWDNFFRHNPELILILCGSSPPFMIESVIRSKALYNRSQHELPLKEFNLSEAKAMLSHYSNREVFDAYLTVGGIPEYLKRLHQGKKSIYLNLCKESFLPGAFFAYEYERIFTSSLGSNKHYKKIISFLSRRRFANRQEIMSHLKLKSGGALSQELADLEICGFIDSYLPFNSSQQGHSLRFTIADPYMQFYFRFIEPKLEGIEEGNFNTEPLRALNMTTFQQWLGYAFERFCRKSHRQIATLLGFQGVNYRVGAYYSKKSLPEESGFQIDLVFDRDDKVLTICEIKYSQTPVSTKVIEEFEKKLAYLPNGRHKSIQRVLISTWGPDKALEKRAYFDAMIQTDDFFIPFIWK